MIMFRMRTVMIIAFCAGVLSVSAQTGKKINTLQSQRANLQKKITENEGMLKTLKKDVRSQLNNLSVIDGQISTQKKLVDAISADVGQLDKTIRHLNSQLDTLKRDLDERKQRYCRSMLYLYRNRTTQNKLMFIFSAGNFTQMYRRLRYVRQYAEYQRVQGELVKRKQEQVRTKHAEVTKVLNEKNVLLAEGKQEQMKLEGKHAERKKIVDNLQKQQRKVQSTLQANKKQYNSLNAQIEKLIQQQIAEEKRRREEARRRELERQKRIARQKEEERRRALAASKKGSSGSKSRSTAKSSSKDYELSPADKKKQMEVFEMEKADRALSSDFASNRGRLPMPITGAYMITTHYGQYNVDGLKGVQLDNKGINITGKPGARARAVFDGEVSAVFSFGGYTNVLVRHGSYISVYCNLASSSVRKGQKVRTRDIIGSVARDASGNCTMHFQLRRETSKLNPESWLAR